jgi:hypothetical protein
VADAVAHSLHSVFLVAAPIAAVALLVALFLEEVRLRGPGGAAHPGPSTASEAAPEPVRVRSGSGAK